VGRRVLSQVISTSLCPNMQSYGIFLFNLTPSMAKPWADAGVLCYLVDIQHPPGANRVGNLVYVGSDARHWVSPHEHKPIILICNPPCTDLAVSGARWFRIKGLRRLSQAIELFAVSVELADWADCPFLIENPVSTISSYWRKPDHSFHPWEYAGYLPNPEEENTTKLTCLWTGGGFVMPERIPASDPHRNDCWKLPPSEDRANLRSASPMGFSLAVFKANHKPSISQEKHCREFQLAFV
jgi:hypothetical protein